MSGPNIENDAGRFVDHWLAASGPSAIKRDWHAAWRNWIRLAVEFRERDAAREKARANGYRKRTLEDIADAAQRGLDSAIADQERWGMH